MMRRPPRYTLFPLHDALPISDVRVVGDAAGLLELTDDLGVVGVVLEARGWPGARERREDDLDRKSTRLNSSHRCISYAVFCLKKKKIIRAQSKPHEHI